MCSDGQTVGVSAIAVTTSSVKSRRVRAGEADACDSGYRADRPEQLAQGGAVAERAAVRVDVLPQGRDLEDALLREHLDLAEDVARAAVLLLAARRRTMQKVQVLSQPTLIETKALGVLARRAGSALGKTSSEQLDLRRLLDADALEQHRQRPDVVGAEDDVDVGRALDARGLVLRRQAPADGDLHAGRAVL